MSNDYHKEFEEQLRIALEEEEKFWASIEKTLILVENPVMQTREEVRRDFDGWCVCVMYCTRKRRGDFFQKGKVVAKAKWEKELRDVYSLLKEKYSDSVDTSWEDFTHSTGIDLDFLEVTPLD
jgi:hypothetical protein